MDNLEYLVFVFNFFIDFDIFYYENRYKINKVF